MQSFLTVKESELETLSQLRDTVQSLTKSVNALAKWRFSATITNLHVARLGVGIAPDAAAGGTLVRVYSGSADAPVTVETASSAHEASLALMVDGSLTLRKYGATAGGGVTFLGGALADAATMVALNASRLLIGTSAAQEVILGTADTAAITISATQNVTCAQHCRAATFSAGAALIAGATISMGTTASSETATPLTLNMGGTYANTAGDPTKMKLRLFDNGVSRFGLSVSASALEYYSKATSTHAWYCGTQPVMSLSTTGTITELLVIGNEGGPAYLTLSADESDDNGDDWRIRSDHTTNQLQFQNDVTGVIATKVYFTTGGSVVVADDVYRTALTSFSPATTGWVADPTRSCYYKRIGRTMHVWYYITGTDDGVTAAHTMTLPVAASASAPATGFTCYCTSYSVSAGGWLASIATLGAGATDVTFYLGVSSTAWPSPGETHRVKGYFCYETD